MPPQISTGDPTWTLIRLHAALRNPEVVPHSGTSNDINAQLGAESSDQLFALILEARASHEARVDYEVVVQGTWPHSAGRTLSDDEIVQIIDDHYLDELSAVVNAELQTLALRMRTPVPRITGNALEELRAAVRANPSAEARPF